MNNRMLIKSLKIMSAAMIKQKNITRYNVYIRIIANKNHIIFLANNEKFEINSKNYTNKIMITGECIILFDKLYKISTSLSLNVVVNIIEQKNNIIITSHSMTATINKFKYVYNNFIHNNSCILGIFNIERSEFVRIILGSAYSLPSLNNETRLNNMLWEIRGNYITFVSTDGKKLGINKMKIKNKQNYYIKTIIPHFIINELPKIFDDVINLCIIFGDKWIKIDSGITSITSLLLSNFNYPNYQEILKINYTNNMLINSELFKIAIKNTSSILDPKQGIVTLKIKKNNLIIIGQNIDSVGTNEIQDIIKIIYVGKKIQLSFYVKHLLLLFNIIKSKTIILRYKNCEHPVLFEGNQMYGQYILSPIKR